MDLILNQADALVFTPLNIYPNGWTEEFWVRQTISVFMIVLLGGYFLYFSFGILSYYTLFDHSLRKHPKFIPNQEWKEISLSSWSMPIMNVLTLPIFVAEVRGHSQLYDGLDGRGWGYLFLSLGAFLFFNDMMIYWIHRFLHWGVLYKFVHKPHHRWLVPTPFASHAFHPLDGFAQSTPYHLFVFLVPLNKIIYLTAFVMVNFWTISIHDSCYLMEKMPAWVHYIVNGAAHHTDHHLYFNYNFGQYFTLWDRIGGSFREPVTPPHDHILCKEEAAALVAKQTTANTWNSCQQSSSQRCTLKKE